MNYQDPSSDPTDIKNELKTLIIFHYLDLVIYFVLLGAAGYIV